MVERIRELDWATTPLGPVGSWPAALRTLVDMMLPCGFAMILLWGPELVQIYNDPCRIIVAGKHPSALGQPYRVTWPEVWDLN